MGVGFDAELGYQNACCAADEGGVNADTQTKSVKNGHDGQHFHAGNASEAGGGNGLQCQCVKVAVGKADALGGAGGATGIEDHGAVVGVSHRCRQRFVAPDQIPPKDVALPGKGILPGQRIQQIFRERQSICNFKRSRRDNRTIFSVF